MSTSGGGTREVAYRLFAAEYDDADYSYAERDEERAPKYVITPTGARANRLFVVGVLTEVESVNEEMVRGRVVDPTGAFVVYAGQYQPEALAALERAEPPTFVAVTGKARTFQPEDGDRIFTSVRPEAISTVDAETRNRWTVQAAERTIDRVQTMAAALTSDRRGAPLRAALRSQGVAEGLAAGIPLAIDHYGTTPTYLAAVRDLALDALRVVAGERDEVAPLGVVPDADGDVTAAELADGELVEALAEPIADEPVADSPDTGADDSPTGVAGGADQDDADTMTASRTEPAAEDSTPDVAVAGNEDHAGDRAPNDDDLEDFEPGDFALDDDQRQEVEETYGTEFETGAEVDDPGEAGIEPETASDDTATDPQAPADADAPTEEAPEPPAGEASTAGESDAPSETPDGPADLEEAVLTAMANLDEGEGAERDAVVQAVLEDTEVDRTAVEDAIQEALMDGQCYEPGDGRLKAI